MPDENVVVVLFFLFFSVRKIRDARARRRNTNLKNYGSMITIAKIWKQTKYPSINECIKDTHTHTHTAEARKFKETAGKNNFLHLGRC